MMVIDNARDVGSLLAASQWLEGVVQGPLAVTLAVIAVAGTGLMMFSGRLAVRRGLIVTLGCFVLFGAPTIAKGLYFSATRVTGGTFSAQPEALPLPLPDPEPAKPQGADPYAGASLAK